MEIEFYASDANTFTMIILFQISANYYLDIDLHVFLNKSFFPEMAICWYHCVSVLFDNCKSTLDVKAHKIEFAQLHTFYTFCVEMEFNLSIQRLFWWTEVDGFNYEIISKSGKTASTDYDFAIIMIDSERALLTVALAHIMFMKGKNVAVTCRWIY